MPLPPQSLHLLLVRLCGQSLGLLSRPLPEDGTTGTSPFDSCVSDDARTPKLSCWMSGTSWASVLRCVAPEAGPEPDCAQFSDPTQVPSPPLDVVLFFLRALPTAAGRWVSLSWCVAPEARYRTPCAQSSDLTQVPMDRTPCAQYSDLTQVPSHALEMVLRSSPWPADIFLS